MKEKVTDGDDFTEIEQADTFGPKSQALTTELSMFSNLHTFTIC